MKSVLVATALIAVAVLVGCGSSGDLLSYGGPSGSGSISVLADPGTDIFIDGTYVGTSSASVSRTPGTYSVEGRRGGSGATCWTRSAEVTEGLTTHVAVTGSCGL